MGETENTSILYLDGKPLRVTDIPEITFDYNVAKEGNVCTISRNQSFSVTMKPIYPKISRKKFIRNLINRGCSKKNAKWLAWYYRSKKISYGKAYSLIIFGLSAG